MNLLDRSYSYDDLVLWGATRIYSEEMVRNWAGPNQRLTVRETLVLPVSPSIIFWALMRPELVEENLMHGLAVDLAETVLAELRRQGVYIDFRSSRLLECCRAWLTGSKTVGERDVAVLKAEQARVDVSELDDPRVWLGAKIAVQAGGIDGRESFRNVFYTALDFDPSMRHTRGIMAGVAETLKNAPSHWSMQNKSRLG
jgi:hypothetical protein